jgi:hypothetical protein
MPCPQVVDAVFQDLIAQKPPVGAVQEVTVARLKFDG